MIKINPVLIPAFILLTHFLSQNVYSEPKKFDMGINKVEAGSISFKQSHLCPYPIELNVKIYNDLNIAGLKKFSYRWVVNGEIIENNGRFEVYPDAYGVGYDVQKKIVYVGNDPETAQLMHKENNSGMSNLMKVFDAYKSPQTGWYQFYVLPAGETNWADAVKSNKASYTINCRT
ncbi:hypothetical protein [sulfur-oxidizing endosymbiont of Gigantopelta aegis]|uniref:hypothetical protein n=1 Tax=sulfur-oxidizing endosymbiont of Gigantopelta aegis TaxID=2794934 RepID=UPI0018DCB7F3|nr:hypothetical protein [sulfur-oxidizing endosymbiont of Gigantopelta aegis]